MSFYATVGGTLTYKSKTDYDKAVNFLKKGHWLNNDGFFVDECDDVVSEGKEEPDINAKTSTITIPVCHYRNLSYHLDTLFQGATGTVVWTSTDGCFSGGVITDGNEEEYDLADWNKEIEGEEEPEMPADDTSEEEKGDYYENLNEWQGQIERDFFEEFLD